MPSLSKTVFTNGWMTISSWIVYLGLNLIAISSPAVAEPGNRSTVASPDFEPQSSTSNPSTTEFNLASIPQDDKLASVPAPSSSTGISEQAVSEQAVSEQAVSEQAVSEQIIAIEPNLTEQSPVSVTVSAEQCLADCNPTEQFDFVAPTNIAIPPRSSYQRPVFAENPALLVPSYPAVADSDSAVPPPPPTDTFATSPSTPTPSRPERRDDPPAAVTAQNDQSGDSGVDQSRSRRALTPPSLQFQGVYLYQGGEDSARVRVTGVYPILPELQVGGSIDFTDGEVFSESGDNGLEVNELYVAASIPDYPNLRIVVGQIDLTSYFDRNSFAKDSAQQFFNPLFATNPALSAASLGSRQGAVVNWTITDEIEAKAAVFSSDRSISDFELNAFAGEVGARLGNFIIRGTYVTAEDAGANTSFEESFQLQRSNGEFGPRDGDREDAYGINAEYFIPEINLGLFARYGWYENRDLDQGGSTYSVGVNLLDLFMEDDRLGIAYGRTLSNDDLRDGDNPDVFEAFYDFRVLPGLRVGLTFQGLDEFTETIAGFRIRTDFDLVPRRTR